MRVIAAASDWAPIIFIWLAAFTVFLLIPCSIFRPTRRIAGVGFLILAFPLGLLLWFSAALSVYAYWGLAALVISSLLMGIPTVVAAFVATLLNGTWSEVFGLAVMTIAAIGSAMAGVVIGESTRLLAATNTHAAPAPKTDVLDHLFGKPKADERN